MLVVEIDVLLKRLIDEEYTRHPFYGSRKMVVYLGRCGHRVNRKRAQRLMCSMGLGGHCAGAQHELGAPAAQGVPVSAARRGGGAAQPSVKHGHHLHPLVAGLYVLGGHHRLVLEEGAQLAYPQQH